jgi:hypothetical protein
MEALKEAAATPRTNHRPVAAMAAWSTFCEWMAANYRGIRVTIESIDVQGNPIIEARNQPLQDITLYVQENGVPALKVVVATKPQPHILNLSGPHSLTVRRNAAGWPTRVECDYRGGRAILHFDGIAARLPRYSSNFWGE